LLALASVLGVGEGHLLHRETRWVGSRYFAKSESLFQSFPSDFAGVVWTQMNDEGWKQALSRELQDAGFEIDWNKVMRG